MYKAYVLVKVVPHQEDTIMRELSKIPAVVEAHKLFGQFDLIVEIERQAMRQIMESITQLRGIKGVLDTITNLVADFETDVHGGPI
jgi:DNA-binding Lrp family transcriptional regulator